MLKKLRCWINRQFIPRRKGHKMENDDMQSDLFVTPDGDVVMKDGSSGKEIAMRFSKDGQRETNASGQVVITLQPTNDALIININFNASFSSVHFHDMGEFLIKVGNIYKSAALAPDEIRGDILDSIKDISKEDTEDNDKD